MSNPIPLSALHPGQSAIITHIKGEAPGRRRFLEMGFARGETIRVERVAPLGDPVEYLIKGTHLSLRQADAENIFVDLLISDHE